MEDGGWRMEEEEEEEDSCTPSIPSYLEGDLHMQGEGPVVVLYVARQAGDHPLRSPSGHHQVQLNARVHLWTPNTFMHKPPPSKHPPLQTQPLSYSCLMSCKTLALHGANETLKTHLFHPCMALLPLCGSCSFSPNESGHQLYCGSTSKEK